MARCSMFRQTVCCAVHGTDTEEGVEPDVAWPLLSQAVSCAVYFLVTLQVPTQCVVHAPSASPQNRLLAGCVAHLGLVSR